MTAICLVIAFAVAYFLARYVSRRWARLALLVIIVPFWSSYLLRVYSWQAILGEKGALNQLLMGLGTHRRAVAAVRLQRHRDVHRPDLRLHAVRDPGPVRVARAIRLHAADRGPGPRREPVRAFRHILLPQIRPGLITACDLRLHPDPRRVPDAVDGRRRVGIADRQPDPDVLQERARPRRAPRSDS